MKRVVTGYDQDGKSVVVTTGEPPCGVTGEHVRLMYCWETKGLPVLPGEQQDPTLMMTTPFPGPDGTTFVIAQLAGNSQAGMHMSDTVDYLAILSGEMWLVLDSGTEVLLTPGDCVVQNGTMHAWDNRGSEPCVWSAVLVGANRQGEA
jgi:mannose-6-phosphate isomerase-like protein (cupin superfamily)